ncbi:MAG: B12-binding domain-containing radical SAM protein [Saprospiraceae bacterium]
MADTLLITAPFTQLNTPYPATAYLKGFLNTKQFTSFQIDLGIEVILEMFCKKGLTEMFDIAGAHILNHSENSNRIYSLKDQYIDTIDSVISFLQGDNETLARQIFIGGLLPRCNRFEQIEDMDWAFGNMGLQDKAKHLATLYLEDISDFIIECIDDNFGFCKYAERLGLSANTFDELYDLLHSELTFIDKITIEILDKRINDINPKLICFSVPFPGNLYSTLRCCQYIKQTHPNVKIAMGGGFPNTELRSITDPRVFEFVDYITLDDGELPIEILLSNTINSEKNNPNNSLFKRTFLLVDGVVEYNNYSLRQDYKQADIGTPDYTDLLLNKYISVIQITNPMHSLWSDGRWNKMTMAHGCYWKKCTFCDVSLDYIGNYEPLTASILVDRMEKIIYQTGERGFHFVDEAAPPALMREVALEILRRRIIVTWWTNIRFEKRFTLDLCRLLKASGCIAVSGGLEVASDRLLQLIKKGVSVEQVAKVTRNFTESEIMVHTYLMYGYPSQTEQETIDSLEMVRQLFELGIVQSAFWHQFALTAHSPIGKSPKMYGIIPDIKPISFANNDIQFYDSTGIDHSIYSYGLKKSLFNYMHAICFDYPLQEWFDFEIPETSIAPGFISSCLNDKDVHPKTNDKIVWLGGHPQKVDNNTEFSILIFHTKTQKLEIELSTHQVDWFLSILTKASLPFKKPLTFGKLKSDFLQHFDDFEDFWNSEAIIGMKAVGLLVV